MERTSKVEAKKADEEPVSTDAFSQISKWIVVVMILIFTIGAIYAFVFGGINPQVFERVVLENFAASVGLPAAAAAALFIVLLLRITSGPIEFQGLGFRFKGAGGPIILWVICFLAIVGAIKLLWR